VRLFAAVDLTPGTRDAMAAEQRRIAAALGAAAASVKWVRPDNAHLTLVFLGDVDGSVAPALIDAVGRDVHANPFDITFSGVGLFPPRGAPRVLWTGIAAGTRALEALHRELSTRIAAHGVPLEARAFHPHLTLGRWTSSRNGDRAKALAAGRPGVIARQTVEWATLYQSRLSPSGASYTPLARANLTGA
jgi:2'-5' RNA ligase